MPRRTFAAPVFGIITPPQRRGPISLRDEFLPPARQPCVQTPRLDLFERYPVEPRRARVGVGALVGVKEDVLATDLVEQVETLLRFRLRLTTKLSLKDSDPLGRFEAHRQSPFPLRLQKHDQKSRTFPPPELPAEVRRCRAGGGALSCLRADLRPPLKRNVQFSRIPLSWIGMRSLKRGYQ